LSDRTARARQLCCACSQGHCPPIRGASSWGRAT
jgi:hypothetical protein